MIKNNQITSPLFLIASFLGSEESLKFNLDMVDVSILYTLSRYMSMNSDHVCYAKRNTIMREARIKSPDTYAKHINKLRNFKLIKYDQEWKLYYQCLGDFFYHKEEFLNKSSSTFDVSDEAIKSAKRTSSSPPNVLDPVRQTYLTIENKNIENKNIDICDPYVHNKILPENHKAQKENSDGFLFQGIEREEDCIHSHDSPDSDKKMFYEENNSFPIRKLTSTENCKDFLGLRFVSDEFQKFLSIYPNREIDYAETEKQWYIQDCQKSSSEILKILQERLEHDSYFFRQIKNNTTQFIPTAHNFLKKRIWELPYNKKEKGESHEDNFRNYSRNSDTHVLTHRERIAEIYRDRFSSYAKERESDSDFEIIPF